MFDALAVWGAVEYRANLARLTAMQARVLHAVLNQTIRYQRQTVTASRSRLAALADVHPNSIGAVLDGLVEMGFITYTPGSGKAMGRVGIIIPEGWEQHEQDQREVAEPATPPVAESATPEAVVGDG